MAYTEEYERTDRRTNDVGMTTGRATTGALGLFVSLGVGIALLAFVAAWGLQGLTQVEGAALVPIFVVATVPLIAAPILSVLAGSWAGTRVKQGGQGALAGAGGAFIGTILMFVIVALGSYLGILAAGVDLAALTFPEGMAVSPQATEMIGFLASAAGIMYLIANAVVGAVAGSIAGALARHDRVDTRRGGATRRPTRV